MPPQTYNDWSPWMKALMMAQESEPSPEQQAAATPAQPSASAPPAHRIEDERSAGTRGTTPQSDSFYAGASHPVMSGAATLPLEKRIAENKQALRGLPAAGEVSTFGSEMLPGNDLKHRIGQTLLNVAGGGIGRTNRDKALAERTAERTRLENETGQDTRTLSQEQLATQRMQEQERMQRATQIAAAERLGQTLSSRQNIAEEQGQVRKDIAGENIESREGIASRNLTERASESAAKIQLARDVDAANNAVKKEIANARIAAGGQKLAPQILKQAQTAKTILPQLDAIEAQTYRMANQLGPAAGRWNEFMTGKVGAPNPEFANYMGQMTFLESAVTLAHSQGRVSNLIFEQFQKLYDAGRQSPENMIQFIHATRTWMRAYADVLDQPASSNTTVNDNRPRPANVPSDYVFNENGPKGRGWYKPSATKR